MEPRRRNHNAAALRAIAGVQRWRALWCLFRRLLTTKTTAGGCAAAPAVLSNDEMTWEQLQPLLEAVDCGASGALLYRLIPTAPSFCSPPSALAGPPGSAVHAGFMYESRVTERAPLTLASPVSAHCHSPVRSLSCLSLSLQHCVSRSHLRGPHVALGTVASRVRMYAYARGLTGNALGLCCGDGCSDHFARPRQAAAPCGHRCATRGVCFSEKERQRDR